MSIHPTVITVSGENAGQNVRIAEAIGIDLGNRGFGDMPVYREGEAIAPGVRYAVRTVQVEGFRTWQPLRDSDPLVEAFLDEVRQELMRARRLFPGDRIMGLAFTEEAGELVKAMLDEPSANVRKEAVQVATMAARIVLDGDSSVVEWRRGKGLDQIVEPARAA